MVLVSGILHAALYSFILHLQLVSNVELKVCFPGRPSLSCTSTKPCKVQGYVASIPWQVCAEEHSKEIKNMCGLNISQYMQLINLHPTTCAMWQDG